MIVVRTVVQTGDDPPTPARIDEPFDDVGRVAAGGDGVGRVSAGPEAEARDVLGGQLRARQEPIIRPLRGPVVGPNAPLLIRLVRRPYSLRPGLTTVVPDSKRLRLNETRDPIAAPAAPFRPSSRSEGR